MPAGRPRTVSLPPDEMIKLAEEMIKFVVEDKNDILHLSEWYCIEKGYTDAEWDTMHVAPEFFPYYEKALKIIGKKYLSKTSSVRDGISQRWQRVYFKDLKREEDETAVFNAQITKQSETQGTEEQNRKLDQLLDVMRSTQQALKSEDTSSNSE